MPYNRRDYRDKWRIERLAADIRERLGLDQLEVLSPYRLCDAVPAHVFVPADIADTGLQHRLAQVAWDGFSFTYPDEPTVMVLLNPERAVTRQTATLMEELSHHLLGHRPSIIRTDRVTGLPQRDYNASQEAEAYDLGGALLLPKERIQLEVANQRVAREIAADHGCSRQLVEYRIKRLRLWGRYSAYTAKWSDAFHLDAVDHHR
jgi:Zn-dependent peptidase ImmA (M78 family)